MAQKDVNIQPLGMNVLVTPREEEDTTPGGLIIPPSAGESSFPAMGTVIKLGTGDTDENGKEIPFRVKVGDVVFYKKYAPEEISVDGESYYIVPQSEILAIVK